MTSYYKDLLNHVNNAFIHEKKKSLYPALYENLQESMKNEKCYVKSFQNEHNDIEDCYYLYLKGDLIFDTLYTEAEEYQKTSKELNKDKKGTLKKLIQFMKPKNKVIDNKETKDTSKKYDISINTQKSFNSINSLDSFDSFNSNISSNIAITTNNKNSKKGK